MLADNELRGGDLQEVQSHVASCPACRRELDLQGALDMLLRSQFTEEPTEGYFNSFWPSVSDRIDGGPPDEAQPKSGGGKRAEEDGDLVFKSSSAMQMLSIPERRVTAMPPPSEAATAPSRPWRWPLTFILATGIAVAGLVYYKKTTTPPLGDRSAALPGQPPTFASARNEVQPDSGVRLAMADPIEAGAPATAVDGGGAPTGDEEKDKDKERAAVGGRARHAKAKGAGKEGEPAHPAGASAAAKPKTEAKTEGVARPSGKKDDLDQLIDKAIGSEGGAPGKTKKAPAAAPAAPASDLPDQLDSNQVRTAMGKVKGLIQSCYDQYQVEGMAKVTFTIGNDGNVGDSSIKGKFFGTDTGTCVVNAVKKARFPKFKGKPMTISNYPFQLQ